MRSNRSYVKLEPVVIEQVRQMDLLSYFQRYESDNLKHVARNVYCTREHDSLKISNGKWYWWLRGFGGVSALDYLIKVKEYCFVEALEVLQVLPQVGVRCLFLHPRRNRESSSSAAQK